MQRFSVRQKIEKLSPYYSVSTDAVNYQVLFSSVTIRQSFCCDLVTDNSQTHGFDSLMTKFDTILWYDD